MCSYSSCSSGSNLFRLFDKLLNSLVILCGDSAAYHLILPFGTSIISCFSINKGIKRYISALGRWVFFEIEDMVPMIETTRGCPYACTFCCWGDPSLSRLSPFSDERVHAELDYIAKHSNKYTGLMFADANFGILKRDVLLAKYINKLKQIKL